MECKNCQTHLTDESDYCYSCGGKVIRNRLTMRNLFENFTQSFFNYDNQFFRTFIHLLVKPWEVIDSYVTGTRKKYISPLSFFAISLTLSGIYVFVVKKYFIRYFDMSSMYSKNMPDNFGNDMINASLEYYSFMYFLMIPGLALISRIVFFNKHYNYTEHMVMYFYTMSLVSILSSILSISILTIHPESMMFTVMILYVAYFIYQCYLNKRLFSLSVGQTILRTLFFIPIFLFGYVIFSVGVFLVMLLFGVINLQDFAPPSS